MKQAIICVDDEEIILEALKGQLAPLFENQFGIEVAQSSTDALDIYDELIADGYEVPIVISDYLMPGMRGDEFLIKIHEKNPDTLNILLTGHTNIEGITNAINKANLYRFIPKPWDRDDLILTVREAIRSFLQERKIKENNDELQAINDNLEKLVIDRTYELEMANVTKDIFISIISHDLKNSFNGILGFSGVLLKDFNEFNDEQKISILTNINQLSDQTYKLLENMLQWALMQRGGIKFNPLNSFFPNVYRKSMKCCSNLQNKRS
jgi:response regulator RpfG family c-di-GMP phosphodiesterase